VTWDGYVAAYHDANPGITEDVLAAAYDEAGGTPYDWLLEALPPPAHGPDAVPLLVDLACGSGAVLRRLGAGRAASGRVVGVDRSESELARARRQCPRARLLRADARRLPLAGGVAGVVTASMALMVMAPADEVLAEVARVLRPGGRMVATVPTRSVAATGFSEVLAALGQGAVAYPESLEDAGGKLREAGLELVDDTSASFSRKVEGADEADLVVRSFYAPGAGPAARQRAAAVLRRRLAAGPVALAYPIRRIVAVRR
jgi:SAM-dependent methyltransferase